MKRTRKSSGLPQDLPVGHGIFWQVLILSLLLAALVVFSSGLGYMRISFSDVVRIVLAKLPGMD